MRANGIFTDKDGNLTLAPPCLSDAQHATLNKWLVKNRNSIIWNGLIGYYSDGGCGIEYKCTWDMEQEIWCLEINHNGTIKEI